MGQNSAEKKRMAQIEKEIEREDITELELMRLELELLNIKSKLLRQFDRV